MNNAIVLAVIGCVLHASAANLNAAPGYDFTLPSGTKNPSGLSLSIHDRGIDANGYRPIRVEVVPRPFPKPLVADRQVRVVLEFSRYGLQNTTQVSEVIELPEGSTGETIIMLAPQTCGWSQLSVRTYEGGEKLLDLSQDYLGWPNTSGWAWTEARPAILFIDSNVPTREQGRLAMQNLQANGVDLSPTYTLPDVRPLLANFPDPNAQPRPAPGATGTTWPTGKNNFAAPQISDAALLSLIWPRSRTEMAGLVDLPTRWLELSQYDVATISLADLEQLASANKERFATLRDWLSTGPLLVVYGVGDEFSRLAELERLLDLSELPPTEGAHQSHRGWIAPVADLNTGALRTPFDDNAEILADVNVEEAESVAKQSPPPIPGWPGDPPFLRRSAGLGCIVAIAAENPFPGKQSEWAWLFNTVPENHWKWFHRTGLSLQRTNDDYWKFLIPGVGEAPVIPFMVLVTLFAVVIGPINFYVLRRWRRLYLLLLTVPAGATLVTASLIAFALASDGIRVRLRVRSFAEYDQRTGRAAVWSRQSYYAALAPSQGLAFPADTAVFSLAYEPGDSAADRATLLHWDGDQHLRRGYLSARTATQFMTCRATTSPARLLVKESTGNRGTLEVVNRLGSNLKYLLVRNQQGEYFGTEQLPDGVQKAIGPISRATAYHAMRAIARPVQPADPQDYNPRLHNDNLFTLISGNRNRLPNSDGGAGDPMMARSLLETNLAAYMLPDGPLGAQRGAREPHLAPGSYLAIINHSPFVVPGIPRAREEASLHVIRGRY